MEHLWWIAPSVVCCIFGLATFVGPWCVPNVPNRNHIRVWIAMWAALWWLFWALCYFHQMNPIAYPKIGRATFAHIARHWGKPLK